MARRSITSSREPEYPSSYDAERKANALAKEAGVKVKKKKVKLPKAMPETRPGYPTTLA